MTVKNETPDIIRVGDTIIEPNTSKEIHEEGIMGTIVYSAIGALKIDSEFGIRRFTRYCGIAAREENDSDKDGKNIITIYCK